MQTSLQPITSAGAAFMLAFALTACDSGSTSASGTPGSASASSAPAAASTAAQPTASTTTAASPAAPEPAGPARPQNVMLLTIDSMRADMPWQGYERDIAPTLTKIASEGVVYTRAYTVSSSTAKSVGAVLTGRYPSSLYRSWSFFTEYSPANVFFTELLQEKGYRTMAGHAHLYFNRGKKLEQGFDLWKMVPGLTWNATTDESVTSDKMTDMAIEMLGDANNTDKPFFLWLHYMDPHDVYVQHEGTPKFGRKARDRYDSEMYFTDMHIKRLLEFAEKQPWWGKTVLMISADHGEAFGEHKMYKHAFALWEVLTHVPLIVKGPGIEPQRIEHRRSQIDLAPTIVDLMGVPPGEDFVGKSLVPELYGLAPPDQREPIILDLPADSNNPPTRAIIQGDYKLIHDIASGGFRLFDLSKDPGELQNLALDGRFKQQLATMRELYEKTWEKIPQVKPFGHGKLVGGGRADGPKGPPGWTDPDEKEPPKK